MPNDYRNLYTPLKQQEYENDIQNVYQQSIEPELRQDLQNEYDSRETSILDKILKAQQPSVNPLLSLMPSNQPKQAPQGAAIGVQVSKEDVFNNPEKQVKTLEKSIKTVSSEKPKEEKVIEFGDENQSSVVGLKSAQEKQSDVKFANNIVRALNAGADRMLQYQGKENPVFDAIDKQADDIVNNYKAQIGAAADDPDSSYSQGMRNYFKTQFGIEIKGKASAAQLNQLMPSASRAYEADLERQAKKDLADEARREKAREFNLRQQEMGLRREEAGLAKEETRKAKQTKEDTDRFDKLSKTLTSEIASSRSAFGVAARNAQSIENAKALLDGVLDYNELDNRQVYELSKTLDRILSQGAPTISGSEKLTPETARSRVQKQLEFISNKRKGAQLGEFVKTTEETLNREQDIAKKQIQATQKKILSAYDDLYAKNPEKFNTILEAQGLPSYEELKKKAPESKEVNSKVEVKSSNAEDKQALEWAKANPSDPRAIKILQYLQGK